MGIDFKLLDHIKDRPLTKLQEDKRRLKEVAQLKDQIIGDSHERYLKHVQEPNDRQLASTPTTTTSFKVLPKDLIRQYRFNYTNDTKVNENCTVEVITKAIENFSKHNMEYSARLDPYDYSLLKGTDFENDE